MKRSLIRIPYRLAASVVLALLTLPLGAQAQVTAVVVGVTPKCPYQCPAVGCFAGASEALSRLTDVSSVEPRPDCENCALSVHLKGGELPLIVNWPAAFTHLVHQNYTFRGVEVTVLAAASLNDGNLIFTIPGSVKVVRGDRLRNKLQWDFTGHKPKDIAAAELTAYDALLTAISHSTTGSLSIQLTGPLRASGDGLLLEMRSWSPAAAAPAK